MRFLFAQAARKKRNARLLKSLSQSGIKKRLLNTTGILTALVAAHTGAMIGFEGMTPWHAFWTTMITFSTIGYGDMSASTLWGQASTIAFGAIGGVAVLANAIGVFQDWRQYSRDLLLEGKKAWNMEDHLVILKSPSRDATTYFTRLMHQFRKSVLPFSQTEVALVSSAMPIPLPEILMNNQVAHINYSANDEIAFSNSKLDKASTIVVLAHQEDDPVSDEVTYSTIARARAANPQARIIAESVLDENRNRMIEAGANNVIRPVRQYPGMLARAILTQGSEQIAEDLFSPHGKECVRMPVETNGTWHKLVSKAIKGGAGILIAYEDENGEFVSGVEHNREVKATSLYFLQNEGQVKSEEQIRKIFDAPDFKNLSLKRTSDNGHVVILNSPKNNPRGYLGQLMYQFRKSALSVAQSEVVVVSPDENVLEKLSEQIGNSDNVKQVPLSGVDPKSFEQARLSEASTIVIMVEDENSPIADDVTYATVARARKENPNARIVAEVVSDENRDRIHNAGADNMIRPVRQYPGMLARAVLTPNSEKVAEDLFSPGGTECVRVNMPIQGKWQDIVSKVAANDGGTVIGFTNSDGNLAAGVDAQSDIKSNALYLLVQEGRTNVRHNIQRALAL